MLKSANGVQMFGDVARRKRYFYALLMILLMIGAAELLMEREIIFPEMAALTIGMWIVDKRVWRVSRIGVVVLMTLGAIAGVCIVRYSPFPLLANLMFAFAFAAICLTLSRATLVPQISACMLPVLLETESWVYPVAVFIMSVIVVGGQWGMERMGLREKITYTSVSVNWREALVRFSPMASGINSKRSTKSMAPAAKLRSIERKDGAAAPTKYPKRAPSTVGTPLTAAIPIALS